MTLWPGDIIGSGTVGTGCLLELTKAEGPWLQKGDVVELEIERLGKGEDHSASIAAASIVAKVTRDRLMQKMGTYFPAFSLGGHKGYGTAEHVAVLKTQGASIVHRISFLANFSSDKEAASQKTLF